MRKFWDGQEWREREKPLSEYQKNSSNLLWTCHEKKSFGTFGNNRKTSREKEAEGNNGRKWRTAWAVSWEKHPSESCTLLETESGIEQWSPTPTSMAPRRSHRRQPYYAVLLIHTRLLKLVWKMSHPRSPGNSHTSAHTLHRVTWLFPEFPRVRHCAVNMMYQQHRVTRLTLVLR